MSHRHRAPWSNRCQPWGGWRRTPGERGAEVEATFFDKKTSLLPKRFLAFSMGRIKERDRSGECGRRGSVPTAPRQQGSSQRLAADRGLAAGQPFRASQGSSPASCRPPQGGLGAVQGGGWGCYSQCLGEGESTVASLLPSPSPPLPAPIPPAPSTPLPLKSAMMEVVKSRQRLIISLIITSIICNYSKTLLISIN